MLHDKYISRDKNKFDEENFHLNKTAKVVKLNRIVNKCQFYREV